MKNIPTLKRQSNRERLCGFIALGILICLLGLLAGCSIFTKHPPPSTKNVRFNIAALQVLYLRRSPGYSRM